MKTKSRKKSETIELPLVTKAAAKAALKKLLAKRAKLAEGNVRHYTRRVQDQEREVARLAKLIGDLTIVRLSENEWKHDSAKRRLKEYRSALTKATKECALARAMLTLV